MLRAMMKRIISALPAPIQRCRVSTQYRPIGRSSDIPAAPKICTTRDITRWPFSVAKILLMAANIIGGSPSLIDQAGLLFKGPRAPVSMGETGGIPWDGRRDGVRRAEGIRRLGHLIGISTARSHFPTIP